jgi:hypothetical protein
MTTVSEIEEAISSLPQEEFWKLAEWFDERKADAWDARIEADAAAGKLHFLWEQAQREIATGQTTDLDAFLADKELSR